jgi:MFS family permease
VTAALLRMNRRTFASIRKYRNYRLFFTGQVISVTGTWMQRIAQAWLVLQLTHSPLAVGYLALAQFLPFTVLGLFAGVLVDRLDPRRTVIATQAIQMVLASAIAAIALGGIARPWHVYVVAALMGAVQVLDAPARQALTYRMVGRRELPNAIALNSSLFNASRIFGPALGGVIIAAAGVGLCFAFNAASYLAVLAGLLLMRVDEMHPTSSHERPAMLRGIREGFAYARRTPRLLVVLGVTLVVSTVCFNFNVLLPVLASETLHSGPRTFGLLSAFFGAGALVGALASAGIAKATLRGLLIGSAGFGGFELLLAPSRSIALSALLLFLIGVSFTIFTSNGNSTAQLEAPDHLRGRVVGLYYYAFNGLGPLGGLLSGWLSARGGTQLAFAVAGTTGLGAAFVALAFLRRRRVRPRAEEREAPPDELLAA